MTTCHYRYDPLDRLAQRTSSAPDTVQQFYQANRLATEISTARQRTVFATDQQLLAQTNHSAAGEHIDLIATDQQSNVLTAIGPVQKIDISYSPYGHRSESGPLPGFNGQASDPLTGHYLMGNGYRAYNPVLMRFNSPDSLSPFGKGGLNAYAYCAGDPVNRIDPTGHMLSPLTDVVEKLAARTASSSVKRVGFLPGKVVYGEDFISDVGNAPPWVNVLHSLPDPAKYKILEHVANTRAVAVAQVSKEAAKRVMFVSAANFKKQGIADLPFQQWLAKLDTIYFNELPGIAPMYIKRQGITLQFLQGNLISKPRNISGRTIHYQSGHAEPIDVALQIRQLQAMNGGGF